MDAVHPAVTRLVITALLAATSGCSGSRPKTEPSPPQIEDAIVSPTGSGVVRIRPELELQGHRGARGTRPESTLPAFEYALDRRVDTLEFDLHLTADDRLVIWHDAFIEKEKCRLVTGDNSLPDPDFLPAESHKLLIRGLTVEELDHYRCDRNPDTDRFPQQRAEPGEISGDDYGFVTLEELFDFVERYAASEEKSKAQRENAGRVLFNMETKRKPKHPEYIADGFDGESPGLFERRIIEVLRKRGMEERTTVQSFDHRSLWATRTLSEDIALAALEKTRGEVPLDILAHRGATVWSPKHDLVTEATVRTAHDAGLRIIPWTVNDADEARRLIRVGVDGIITDRPDMFRRVSPTK